MRSRTSTTLNTLDNLTPWVVWKLPTHVKRVLLSMYCDIVTRYERSACGVACLASAHFLDREHPHEAVTYGQSGCLWPSVSQSTML